MPAGSATVDQPQALGNPRSRPLPPCGRGDNRPPHDCNDAVPPISVAILDPDDDRLISAGPATQVSAPSPAASSRHGGGPEGGTCRAHPALGAGDVRTNSIKSPPGLRHDGGPASGPIGARSRRARRPTFRAPVRTSVPARPTAAGRRRAGPAPAGGAGASRARRHSYAGMLRRSSSMLVLPEHRDCPWSWARRLNRSRLQRSRGSRDVPSARRRRCHDEGPAVSGPHAFVIVL
jgi:hypothetical protein